MKKHVILLALLLLSFFAQSQNNHNHGKGLGFMFSGDGSEEFVCYKQSHRNFFFITFGLVILLGAVVFSRFKTKQRLVKQLEEKNRIIEEKQKEILDSIHYASRIQQSLMASEKYIEKNIARLRKQHS